MPTLTQPRPTAPLAHRPPKRDRAPAAPGFRCANCDIGIVGQPTIHVGLAFCCAGCVAGGPCTCSYDWLPDPTPSEADGQVRTCLDVSALDD